MLNGRGPNTERSGGPKLVFFQVLEEPYHDNLTIFETGKLFLGHPVN